LADTSVAQNLNLDLVPGWVPGMPWEFRTSNSGTVTYLLSNQILPQPGNRVLSINVAVCPAVVSGFYQTDAIALEGDELIGSHPTPTGSYTEIGVPYWIGGSLLRNGEEICTGWIGSYREPTEWELLPPGERRYVGLLLYIEDEIHYGWLGLNVGSLVIDDFAYEDVPDRPIRAGDTVPEPAASLGGLLALGALGVLTRRQHEGKRRRRGLRARTAVAALLLVADAPVAAAAGFDLSMPVRSGDRIDGHDVWSVEGLGPDSLNDAAQIAFLDLYVNQISSQGALSSLRRGADVGETIGGLPFTQVNAGYGAAIDGAGTIAFQSLSSGQGQVVFVPPGFASWNLVGNGEFDTDLSDWTNLGVEKTWSEFDDTNDPSSGSLYIRNEREASIGLLAQQCVPVEAGADYSFGYSHFSAGLDADGRAYAGLNWLTGPSCAGASAGYESFDSYTSNVWTRIEAVVTAPAEAHSLQVDLVAMKQVGEVGSLWSVYFDHVRLPEPGAASGGGGALVALLVCARRRRSR
jgi:hypothetical protein